jgi:hypothetical protein
MKTDKFAWSEGALALAIIVALLILINPFHMLMPPAAVLLLAMLLGTLVIGFALFFWREQPRDERDQAHTMQASRVSYILGAGVLLVAIIIQSLMHDLDVWLPVSLGAMVVGKLLLRWWLEDK